MTDTRILSYGREAVNDDVRRRRWPSRRLEDLTATLSILSEGEVLCDGCGGRIDGKAVYVSGKRPKYHKNHELEIVAQLHPDCYGWKNDE